MANISLQSITFPGLSNRYTVPQVDNTLAVTGAAADAKKVGDEISDLKDDLSEITEELPDTVERKVYTPIAYNLQSKTKTQNGITFTQNTNETINVSGTATSTVMTSLTDANGNELSFTLTAGKTYRLSGCPAGGGFESYRLDLRAGSSGGTVTATDKGSGVIVTIATTGSYIPVIRIGNGTTVNLTFAPEIAEETVHVVNPLSAIDLVAREDLNEITEEIDSHLIKTDLLQNDIPDTTQTYAFADGSVSTVTHTRNSDVIRTDTFTYGSESITEVRTLNTGESLTIVTNLTTLETSITYAVA